MHQPLDPVANAYAGWRSNLVDLASTNPLLFFRPDKNALRLALPAAGELLRQISDRDTPPFRLVRSASPHETGVIVVHPTGAAGAGATLRALRQRARLALDEQGIHILYLTFGALAWETREQEAIESPILIMPVALRRETAFDDYTLTPAEQRPDLTLNPALVAKLKQDYEVDLAPIVRRAAGSLDAVLEAVRDTIGDHFHWTVSDTAWLTLLPFAKYVLHEDLERHQEEFLRHPVVRVIGGDASALKPTGPLSPDTDAAISWQVLDADLSQRATIATIRKGGSVIVQGPPGTGKSQTITNVIAESLGQGKTVLFVSEKKAALQVVRQRLDHVGLGEFCLESHDEALDEAAVVKKLADRSGMGMPREQAIPEPLRRAASLADAGDLDATRARIDAYHAALCTDATPFGGSTYDVIGEIASLAGAPVVQFDYDPATSGGLTSSRVDDFANILDDLRQVASVILEPNTNRWRQIDPTLAQADPATRYRLDERLSALAASAQNLSQVQLGIQRAWGLPARATPESARQLQLLLEHCVPPANTSVLATWFEQETWDRARSLLARERSEGAQFLARRERLLERYRQNLLNEALIQTLDEAIIRDHGGILNLAPELTGEPTEPPALQVPARFAAALLLATLDDAVALGGEVADRYGLKPASSIQSLTRMHRLVTLAGNGKPPHRQWFVPEQHQQLYALAREGQEQGRILAGKDAFLTQWKPRILEEATEDTIARLDEPLDSMWDRVLGLLAWDLPRVEGLHEPPTRLSRTEAAAALRQARAIVIAESWFTTRADDLDREFGHYDAGPATDWDNLLAALDVVIQATDLIDPSDPPAALVDFPTQLSRRDDLVARFGHALTNLESVINLFGGVVPDRLRPWLDTISIRPVNEVATDLRWPHLRGQDSLVDSANTLAGLRLQPWTTFDAFIEDLREATALIDRERELRDTFGVHYTGGATNWDAIGRALDWIGRIRGHFGMADPPAALVTHVTGSSGLAGEQGRTLTDAIARFDVATVTRLGPFFLPGAPVHDGTLETLPLESIGEWATELHQDLGGLEHWLFSLHVQERARELGMLPFIHAVRDARIPVDLWINAFDLQLRTLWLTWRLREAQALTTFSRALPDNQRERFAALDRTQLAANAVRLIDELRERQAKVLADPARQPEIATLRRLASAGGSHPLRSLCGEAASLLPALAPCFLMSPMSVARLLGHSPLRFDVVIFDEASQVLPEDAIGAIGRGRQAVVVGDSQQLPPTSFFQAGANGSGQSESLLDACTVAGLPNTWLQWHYRSRHEDLIAFSNREFYDNRLVTFPSPDRAFDPIAFNLVADGVYDRGGKSTNLVEARNLVDHLVEAIRATPDASFGVIAFSEAQMLAIQEELDLRRRVEPDLVERLTEEGADGLFVRNLENVQGDERDHIFLSVGYGPDHTGRTMHNFGPINRDGGDRRLNVAITRARRSMTVLASFDPNELRSASANGVQVLHRYLNFARQDPEQPRPVSTVVDDRDRGLVRAVAQALTRAGLEVVRDVGVGQCRVDIGIVDPAAPGRFLLGILCDGTQYRSATDSRDRDRLRPQMLEALGWRLHHLWSMAWLTNSKYELDRIVDLVDRLRRDAPLPSEPVPSKVPTRMPEMDLTGGDGDNGFVMEWGAGEPKPSVEPPFSNVSTPEPIATESSAPEPLNPDPVAIEPPAPELATTETIAIEPVTPEPEIDTPSEPEMVPPDSVPEPEPTTIEPIAPDPVATEPAATEPIATEKEAEPVSKTSVPEQPKPRIPKPRVKPVAPRVTATSMPAPAAPDAETPDKPRPARRRSKPASSTPKREQGVAEIKGLPPAALRQLDSAGIGTLGVLLERTATRKARADLAKELGVEVPELTDWVNRADLMRVTGIGTQFADLLELCGVASCRELRQRVPENLLGKLKEVNADRALTKRLPTLAQVQAWIAQAKAIATSDGPREQR